MEKEKLYDKWTATGIETIKACVEDKIANYCELNKKQCQEVLNLIDKQQKLIEELRETCNKYNDMRHFALVAHKYVSKDKIKEKIDELGKEYNNLFTEGLSLDTMNINSHRYDAMKTVLEELLEG